MARGASQSPAAGRCQAGSFTAAGARVRAAGGKAAAAAADAGIISKDGQCGDGSKCWRPVSVPPPRDTARRTSRVRPRQAFALILMTRFLKPI